MLEYQIQDFEDLVKGALKNPRPENCPEDGSFKREYDVMLAWFKENDGKWTADKVRLGALAVYGWMPTILRAEGRKGKRRNIEFDKIATYLNEDCLPAKAHNFINGSFVGTSKFLHFWRPGRFAIWDRRVATALKFIGVVNSRKKFDSYQHDIRAYCKKYGMSIREIELALFMKADETD